MHEFRPDSPAARHSGVAPAVRYRSGSLALRLTTLALGLLPLAAHGAPFSLVEQLSSGGIPLIAIAAMSILGLAVILERMFHLRARAIVPDGLVERLAPLSAQHDAGAINALLHEDDSTLGRVAAYLVAHRHEGRAAAGSGAADLASLELRQHQQKAYALSIIATVAPIVGLLGTVLGMIEAFHVIAYEQGMGNPTLLAGGISKALVNTACGLAVALPALAMHHYFKHRVSLLGLRLERQINALLEKWTGASAEPEPVPKAMPHAH